MKYPKSADPKYKTIQVSMETFKKFEKVKELEDLTSDEALDKLTKPYDNVNDKIYLAWKELNELMKIYCGNDVIPIIELERVLLLKIKDNKTMIEFMRTQLDNLLREIMEMCQDESKQS